MSSASLIGYSTQSCVTPETEISALASIYTLAIRKAEEAQKGTGEHENIARAMETAEGAGAGSAG